MIRYTIPTSAHVKIVVYDVFGREVARIVDEPRGIGTHETRFRTPPVASGRYIVSLEVGSVRATRLLITAR